MYTFWDYMRNRWERDGGLRLDHILLSPVLRERLQGAGIDRHIRGLEDASDHAPVWAELHDAPDRPSSASLVGDYATATATTASPKAKKSARRTGREVRSQTRAVREPRPSRRPLLVIDGDSFAHRSCLAENHTPQRWQGRGRHPWVRQLPAAVLRGRAAPRRYCWMGQLGRANKASQNVSRLPERPRVRC